MRSKDYESEVERLFTDAVDDLLTDSDREKFETQLKADLNLQRRFDDYRRAVGAVAKLPKFSAPDSLATGILLRSRRRRPHAAAKQLVELYRVPIETVVVVAIMGIAALLLWA